MDKPAKIVMQDPAKLTPYAKNAKVHKQQDIDRLAGQIAAFGFDQPILVDTKGVIIKGHKRREAAMQLGVKKVPTLVSERDEYDNMANRLADNAVVGKEYNEDMVQFELGTLKHHNYDLSLTGYDTGDLERHMEQLGDDFSPEPSSENYGHHEQQQGAENGSQKKDDIPEEIKSVCKEGDLWRLGSHWLFCGDSTQKENVTALMQGKLAACIFTDPPYNIASETGGFAKNSDNKQMARLMQSSWDKDFSFSQVEDNLLKCLGPDGSVYVCTSHHLAASIWNWMRTWSSLNNYCIWAKPNPMPSLAKRHYTWSSEIICYATRGKHTFNFADQGHDLNVWHINKVAACDLHPTMKPVGVPEHAIRRSSNSGDVVVDLFGGAGSTLMACETLQRSCHMMEMSPHYCDVIIKRWQDFTGQQAVKV